MRKKNPAIQKWVNSIQNPEHQASTSSNYTNDETKLDNDNKTIDEDHHQRPNVLITAEELNEGTVEDPKCSPKFENQPMSIKRILDKISKSSDKLDNVGQNRSEEDEYNKRKSSYFHSGRNKINEFYEKINPNKSKYSLMKAKEMDTKETIGECQQNLTKCRKSTEKLSEMDAIFQLEEVEDVRINDIKNSDGEKEEEKNMIKIAKQPKMKDIGRSRSENPSLKKRYNLQEIGRSFSEMKDDDENIENIERNHTYPMSSSLNTSSNLTLSTQNVFAKSVPVSPIPRKECKMRRRQTLMKDSSLQSDSSHCSSVESLLNARKPDPEMILVNLGFGPANTSDVLSKIPKRFLKPSKVRGIDTEAFLRQQQLSVNIHENSVLGYRGLVGNPHLAPSSVVANIMRRFEVREKMLLFNRSQSHPVYSNPPSPLPPTTWPATES